MARGFGGLPGNMGNLMKQAQKMQQDIEKAQAEVALYEAEASSGGGMVKAVCNGKHQLVSLAIDPQVIDPKDPEILADMVKAAVNEAMQKVDDMSKETMQKIAGGMSVPGLF